MNKDNKEYQDKDLGNVVVWSLTEVVKKCL